MTTPRVIERNGRLYAWYAGPWQGGPGKRNTRIDHDKPHDVIEDCFASGMFSAVDKPIIHNGAIYIAY